MLKKVKLVYVLCLLISSIGVNSMASKLKNFSVIDEYHVLLEFADAEVFFVDDGKGEKAFLGHAFDENNQHIVQHGMPLDVKQACKTKNWSVTAINNGLNAGFNPVKCYRKSQVGGVTLSEDETGTKFVYDYLEKHYIYLELPEPFQRGTNYRLTINPSVLSDSNTVEFVFDEFQQVSEAIHLNLVGYSTSSVIKSADVYRWMGDGKRRDYSAYVGNQAYLFNTNTKDTIAIGQLAFWKENTKAFGQYNLLQSDVWTVDFSDFKQSGTYRLVVDGIGCSQDFDIKPDVYKIPFSVSTQGFFYMRVGQDSTGGIWPVPRRPLFIPGVSPENTKVLITDMHPYRDNWSGHGDRWDQAAFFEQYVLEGEPENKNAWGGHSDAFDWDRHLGHISNIYDLLLPYFLTNGKIADDDLDIAESGNGLPDVIDEARFETDFFLRLRYKGGYAHGITCPRYHRAVHSKSTLVEDSSKINYFYQAGTTGVAAWANAFNAAMLSNCLLIAGETRLMEEYRDSAIAAFNYANALNDPMLDKYQNIGAVHVSGRDLKMNAAAFLYNITGDTKYEDIIHETSVCNNSKDTSNYMIRQLWGTAAYLLTKREVHYQELFENMRTSLIEQALANEVNMMDTRPSRRSTARETTYFKTCQNLQRTVVAHAICNDPELKRLLEKAMVLEADWGLGRNPLNHIEMTTATTPLEGKRNTDVIFTTGHDDGAPGLHPGHTPYLNTHDWIMYMESGRPSMLTSKCYPSFKKWPQAEAYFPSRWTWSHTEFTPKETMRGKQVLYGYLHALFKNERD